MKKKILVTDGISENAKKMLESKYIVELKKGLPPEELKKGDKKLQCHNYKKRNKDDF